MRKLTVLEIKEWLTKYNIHNYVINDDLSITVHNSVDLGKAKLTHIPVKFKHIDGYFTCADNFLTSLSFCPETVTSFLDISNNKITSLKGISKKIGSNLIFHHNFITNFEHAPQEVGKSILGNFNLISSIDDLLTEFKDALIISSVDESKITGLEDFYKFDNSLIMSPEEVKKYQLQINNQLIFPLNQLVNI